MWGGGDVGGCCRDVEMLLLLTFNVVETAFFTLMQ